MSFLLMSSQKEEESTFSQSCNAFELQEEVKKLKEQLRDSEAEIQQLKVELGQYLFLKDKDKRDRKRQILPGVSRSDESRQYAASSSCNEKGLDESLLVEGVCLGRLPAGEFQHMKELAKGKVNDLKLARMRVAYELLDELERVSEDPRTDIRELLESIQRLDLLEKLGVFFHEGVAAVSPASLPLKGERLDVLSGKDDRRKIVTRKSRVSARSSALSGELDGGRISESREDTSPASFSSFESSAENEKELPASRDTEDYKGLPLERVSNDGTEDTRILFSSEQAGPSSIFSSTRTNSSDSLVLNSAERVQVTCVRGSLSDSCEETEPTEVFLATGSGLSDGITSGQTSSNTGSFEEEISQEAQFSDTQDNVTDVGGNNETIVDDMPGTSIASCNGETRSSWSGPKASPASAESDSGISSSGNAAAAYHSLLNGLEGLIVGDDNQLTLQHNSVEDGQQTVARGECIPDCSSETGSQLPLPQNSNKHDQRTEGRFEPGSDSSPKTGNEVLLQRNSNEYDQRKGERLEPGYDCSFKAESQPPPQQNSSESEQLTEGSREPDATNSSGRNWERLGARPKRTRNTQRPVDPPLWPNSSPVSDGLAKDFLARHSHDRAVQERLCTDDRDLSHLGPERLRDTSFVDGLTSASEAYSARPYSGTMGASPYLLGGSSYSSSTHATATPLSSFTGQTDFSSVWNGMSSNGVNTLPNSRFVYGSTSSDFASGAWYGAAAIHPGYSLYDTQGHVLSNSDSALTDDQMSRNRNLNHESQFGDREQVPGSFAASGVVAGSRDFPFSYTVSSSSFSSTMAVPNLTCRSSVAAASNLTSTVINTTRNSVFSPTLAGDGNEEATHLPASGEDNSKDTTSCIDYGRSTVEPNDNSLVASEQRMAEDASALMERGLREREEFMRELQRKEQMIREEQERQRREKEDREWQEAERWPPQQEGVSTGSRWLCEHYQRRCRVRFPCCTQFYPCHRCHNSSSNCKNDEAKACHATHLKCSLCQLEQEIDENSDVCKGCGEKMAAYFCSLCKHFTSVEKNPYHCDQCGICRIHKDKSFHCKVCNVCLDKRLENNHKCRPDSGHDECCICLEDAFSGCQILPCSHKVHRECAIAMIQNGIRNCPVCRHPLYTPLNE